MLAFGFAAAAFLEKLPPEAGFLGVLDRFDFVDATIFGVFGLEASDERTKWVGSDGRDVTFVEKGLCWMVLGLGV